MRDFRLRDSRGNLLAAADPHIRDISAQLHTSGFVHVPDAVTPTDIERADDEVRAYLRTHPGDIHESDAPDDWDCPTISALSVDPELEAILAALTASVHPAAAGGYQSRTLRIYGGAQSHRTNPYDWHYDANVITVLIPLTVPDCEPGTLGHHATFPNHRAHRRFSWSDVLDKALTQNRVHGRWTARRLARDPEAHTIRFRPGSGYIFCGHRTLHRPMSWPSDRVRATLNLHYGYPYDKGHSTARTFHSVQRLLHRVTA